MVPASGRPWSRPASTREVPAAPASQALRAAARAASTPWARRAPKSTQDRSRRRQRHPGRLRGDQGLEPDRVEQVGLDDLRLDDGGGDPQEGLLREGDGPLRHGPYLAGEAQPGQELEEAGGEAAQRAQVGQGGLVEAEALQVPQGRLQPGGHQEVAFAEVPHPQLEGGGAAVAVGQVGGGHRQLVEVGEQGVVGPPGGRGAPLTASPLRARPGCAALARRRPAGGRPPAPPRSAPPPRSRGARRRGRSL